MSTTTNLGITKLDAGLRQPEVVINNALDALDGFIGGAWTSWTPTWTNLTIGNATVVAKYRAINKTVFCRISVVFGSTTSVSGDIRFSLPVTRATYGGTNGVTPHGTARAYDQSTGTDIFTGDIVTPSTTTAAVRFYNASGTYTKEAGASSTVPFTWTTSDELAAHFCYEAA